MKNTALLFPGQGAQAVGMGQAFYESSPEAKAIFDQADQIIEGLSDVIFNGPQEKLTQTAFCQPGIFTFSVAALRAFQAHSKYKEITPTFSAGLSLGEYAALVACGAIDFQEALRLVERRSFFMEEATKQQKGGMAAVIGFDKAQLVDICQSVGAQVANFNSPDQIVITGDASKVDAASAKIKEAGAKRVIALEVSGAFHSSLMQSAVDPFSQELEKTSFKAPDYPILSNVDAKPETDPNNIRENLAKQITSSVQWVDTITAMQKAGTTTFIEIGPGTVLKGLIRKIDRSLQVFNIQKPEDIDSLTFEAVSMG